MCMEMSRVNLKFLCIVLLVTTVAKITKVHLCLRWNAEIVGVYWHAQRYWILKFNGLFFVRWYVEFCLQVVKLSYIKLICNILGITPFYANHLLKQNLYFKWKGVKSIGVLTNCQCIHVRNKTLSCGPNHNEKFGHAFVARMSQHIHKEALSSYCRAILSEYHSIWPFLKQIPVTKCLSVSRRVFFCYFLSREMNRLLNILCQIWGVRFQSYQVS